MEKEHTFTVSLPLLVHLPLAWGWFFASKIVLMEHSVFSSCFLQLSAWQRRRGKWVWLKIEEQIRKCEVWFQHPARLLSQLAAATERGRTCWCSVPAENQEKSRFPTVVSPRHRTWGGDASEKSLLSSAGTGWHGPLVQGLEFRRRLPLERLDLSFQHSQAHLG